MIPHNVDGNVLMRQGTERDGLTKLFAAAKARVAAMPQAELDEMHRLQRESFVRGEMGWPKPRRKMVDGVMVYESYEDYCA
jgi:hypothetical protein